MVRNSKPANGSKNNGGRPPKYNSTIPDRAFKLCLLGLIDEELAIAFGVDVSTIKSWKNEHPEFSAALVNGKTPADANVAFGLYKRACGFEIDAVHISNYMGEITKTAYKKYFPPDTKAAEIWLNNRQKDKWRKVLRQEVTGADGGPIRYVEEIRVDDATEAELELIHSVGMKAIAGGHIKNRLGDLDN